MSEFTDTFELPFLDISPWTEPERLPASADELTAAQQLVAQKWDEYLQLYGFVILVGHNINPALFDDTFQMCKDFFDRPLKDKMVYNFGNYGHPKGGFTPVGYEKVALSNPDAPTAESKFDPVENFVFTSHPKHFSSPSGEPSPFPPTLVDGYYDAMESLLNTLHRLSAAALHLPALDFFDQYYYETNPTGTLNGNALRLTHYPSHSQIRSQSNTPELFDQAVRYGAHTDYQGFTLLRPDPHDWHVVSPSFSVVAPDDTPPLHIHKSAPHAQTATVQCGGLEVFVQGIWRRVRIPQGAGGAGGVVVVNAGDLIQRWTADRWLSPLHRVVNAQASTETAETMPIFVPPRLSLVFFTGPLEDAVVRPLASSASLPAPVHTRVLLTEDKLTAITAGEHLREKLSRTNQ
eukprot:gene45215-55307_t